MTFNILGKTLSSNVEKYTDYTNPLCLAFTDYGQAFDLVETAAVMNSLSKQGVEIMYVKILEDIRKRNHCLHKVSNEISIQKKVRQGETIFPKVFTVVLEKALKNLDWEEAGIQINGEYLNDFRFADDIDE